MAERSPSSDERPLVGEETETATCRGCGSSYERTVVKVGHVRLTVHECPACEEATASEPAMPTRPRQTVEDFLAEIGVNTRKHGQATIDNFDPTTAPRAQMAAREFVQRTVEAGRHDRVRGLYLVSDAKGTGKTHLAVAIMRAVHEGDPTMSVVFDAADRLITKIQDSYGTGTTDRLIETRARAGLYVLDDLGREKDTTDALRTICTILDEREGAPTVITSNHLPHELGARHTDGDLWSRVASRLGDSVYRYVAVEGRDRRFAA